MTDKQTMTRRSFLRLSAASAGAALLSACAPVAVPTEKSAPDAEPAAQPADSSAPAEASQAAEAAMPSGKYSEAPELANLVANGELPPVDERLPKNPRVVAVHEEIGQYGGAWRRGYNGMSDMQGPTKLIYAFGLHFDLPDPETINIVPGLFNEWSQNDDATEYTFHIREGTRWSDGEPFDTEDVQFWYDWYYLGELGPSYGVLTFNDTPMELEVVDQYTFTVRFAAPNPLLPFRVARDDTEGSRGGPSFGAPAHYLSQFIPELGDQATIDAALAEHQLTSWQELFGPGGDRNGPIAWWAINPDLPVLGAWKTESAPPFSDPTVMVRNPYFYCVDAEGQQLPYIDRIEHSLFEDNNVFDLWITQGLIDMHERHVSAANFTLYKEQESIGNYRVLLWKLAATHAYYPNTSHDDPVLRDLFSNPKFREALSIAINREEINNLVYDGLYEPRQASPVSGSTEYDAEFEQRWAEYDPERATALLDEIGLEVGDDGVRLRPDGERLSFQLLHSQLGNQPRLDEINLVVGYWKAIGLDVVQDAVERSLYEVRIESNQVDVGHWTHDRSLLLQADPRSFVGTSSQQPYVNRYADWWQGEANGEEPPEDHPIREIWAKWEQAATEADAAKRQALMMELVAIHKEAPFAIGTVGEPPQPVIVASNMRNVPDGIVSDTSLRNVRVANPEQFFFEQG